MNKLTRGQLKALHTIFSREGWSAEERHDFIHKYTSGRTSSTTELTVNEAKHLLNKLGAVSNEEREKQRTEARKLVKTIYYLSLQIDFLNKGYSSETEADRQMNYAKINKFCKDRTAAKKPLTQMDIKELQATKRQLESITKKQKPQ